MELALVMLRLVMVLNNHVEKEELYDEVVVALLLLMTQDPALKLVLVEEEGRLWRPWSSLSTERMRERRESLCV